MGVALFRSKSISTEDVMLPVSCSRCDGKVLVTYQPAAGSDIWNCYHCPHCHERVRIPLPGLIVPPVQIRRD